MEPILQITSGLTAYDGLFKFVEDQKNERLSTRQNTLEGHIVKVVTDLYNEAKGPVDYLSFQTIWTDLKIDLGGKIDDKKPNVMDTSEFFDVTKNKIGYRLREVLSGKSDVHREKNADGNWTSTKVYLFNFEKLRRIAAKYGYELVTKLPSLLSSEGVKPSESMDKTLEKHGENTPHTPLELGKLGNSVTEPSKEPITPENSVTGGLLIPCPYCKAQGKQMFFANDRDLSVHVSSGHESSSDYVR